MPASSIRTRAPASVNTLAAMPPPAPEPITQTSNCSRLRMTCIEDTCLGSRLELTYGGSAVRQFKTRPRTLTHCISIAHRHDTRLDAGAATAARDFRGAL